jgi:hypothetical protein
MRLDLHATFASLSQEEDGMLKRKLGEGRGGGGILNMLPLQR